MSKGKLFILWIILLITISELTNAQQPKPQPNKEAKSKTAKSKSDFLIAFSITMKNEGGYVNDKNDIGGETYCGITRKNFPKWAGWTEIDKHKMKHNEKLPELNQLVQNFYKTNFWDKMHGDELEDQTMATMIFDMAVCKGLITSIEIAQQSVGIPMTGKMDKATIQALNNPSP